MNERDEVKTNYTYMSLGKVSGLDDLSFHCDDEQPIDKNKLVMLTDWLVGM